MLRKSKVAARVGVVAGAGLLVFGTATSAYAYDLSVQTDDGAPGGKLYWTADGDVVKVCDQEADGWAAYAKVEHAGDFRYSMRAGGNGNCTSHSASDGGRYNLTEGYSVFLTVCLQKTNEFGQTITRYCDQVTPINNN
ncbi:hypothetical protein OG735_41215 (plasmid) [Streptomyces sp. NBC_01210]|uniref:hypothetical protein n=1 Tax=Streptomyces sp. NBC_01210 TaxID=2903774 RepID=UPI002E0FF402|nr:hypothetical protein OG735_41215 [Streptomyces sp. NBC_01210]